MKLEWRRRTPPRPWLLLRPGPVWGWVLVEQGVATRQGTGKPPADLLARVALIVPGEHCSHFQLAAPPGLKREEWPLLLEDRLLQGAHEVVCACIGRPAGQLRLLVVARQRLDEWRAQCVEWALPVERCWAEFQLLAEPEAGECWQWRRGERVLHLWREDEGYIHWLAWPDSLGQAPARDWPAGARALFEGDWPRELAQLESTPGLFEVRSPRQFLRLAPVQRRLALACMALAVTWGGLWLAQQWRQTQAYREQVLAVTGQQAALHQAAQVLKRLRDRHVETQLRLRQLEGLQAQLQAWLGANPGWRLQAVRFDGRQWRLALEGDGATPPWQEMAAAAGAQVRIEEGARHVMFDLEGGS
ncbi:GspL/Epsl periplasmic domain-containing protein [Pseudomonas entomophila]|uniref:GspL/Epsl periplasmic domain-containing protein n=1 Tax=Pseudomonas entomophila TaxID=312306 RepID=UPI00200D17A8|nr:GspL/Epsl periplasmic domain-containing protein [Pseudomonas entomophila]